MADQQKYAPISRLAAYCPTPAALLRISPTQPVTADGRLEPVATALHEMMSRQLIHCKDGFHRLGVWP